MNIYTYPQLFGALAARKARPRAEPLATFHAGADGPRRERQEIRGVLIPLGGMLILLGGMLIPVGGMLIPLGIRNSRCTEISPLKTCSTCRVFPEISLTDHVCSTCRCVLLWAKPRKTHEATFCGPTFSNPIMRTKITTPTPNTDPHV